MWYASCSATTTEQTAAGKVRARGWQEELIEVGKFEAIKTARGELTCQRLLRVPTGVLELMALAVDVRGHPGVRCTRTSVGNSPVTTGCGDARHS